MNTAFPYAWGKIEISEYSYYLCLNHAGCKMQTKNNARSQSGNMAVGFLLRTMDAVTIRRRDKLVHRACYNEFVEHYNSAGMLYEEAMRLTERLGDSRTALELRLKAADNFENMASEMAKLDEGQAYAFCGYLRAADLILNANDERFKPRFMRLVSEAQKNLNYAVNRWMAWERILDIAASRVKIPKPLDLFDSLCGFAGVCKDPGMDLPQQRSETEPGRTR